MAGEKITTVTDLLKKFSPKNKLIIKKIISLTKEVEPKIKKVVRFNSLFFDLNGWLYYVDVQAKERKSDTLTIGFCQGVQVTHQHPALDMVLEWKSAGLKMIRKIKVDSLQDLETYHFSELLQLMVEYNKAHNTHKEWGKNMRKSRT